MTEGQNMTKTVFFGDRALTINGENGIGSDFSGDNDDDISSAVNLLKNNVERDISISSADIQETYGKVCSHFKEVNAAGGLVSDGNGKYLLIFRNEKWDLPKGHQEDGEEMVMTALREVGEETGVQGLSAGELICVTDHCYILDGTWCLKHTWWYRMECNGQEGLTPQTEEGISRACWVESGMLAGCLSGTYPSIIKVFEDAGVIF